MFIKKLDIEKHCTKFLEWDSSKVRTATQMERRIGEDMVIHDKIMMK